MRRFKFDPETGKRGDEIDQVPRASWAASYLPSGIKPAGFGPIASATVHRDAGIGMGDGEVSYRLPDIWCCFCLGEFHSGVLEDGTPDYTWEWVIVPPAWAVKDGRTQQAVRRSMYVR